MPVPNLTISVEDTQALLIFDLVKEDLSALDLTTAVTVDFAVLTLDGKTLVLMTINAPPTDGQVQVQLPANTLNVGNNSCQTIVNWSGTKSPSVNEWIVKGIR